MRPFSLSVFFAAVLAATSASAQATRDARAVVTIVDMTGAILPGATVTVTPHEPAGATGVVRPAGS